MAGLPPKAAWFARQRMSRGEAIPLNALTRSTSSPRLAPGTWSPADAAFWYLVRAKNASGTGNYGLTSGGSARIGTMCP